MRWVIEAKGETSSTGLDFRTRLGQLLTAMDEPANRYAVAVPDTPRFQRLTGQISPFVRRALGLHWIFVDQDGVVTVEPPPSCQGRLKTDPFAPVES